MITFQSKNINIYETKIDLLDAIINEIDIKVITRNNIMQNPVFSFPQFLIQDSNWTSIRKQINDLFSIILKKLLKQHLVNNQIFLEMEELDYQK